MSKPNEKPWGWGIEYERNVWGKWRRPEIMWFRTREMARDTVRAMRADLIDYRNIVGPLALVKREKR